jgi:3-hydroxybutyryl-CoA dehydrogenase
MTDKLLEKDIAKNRISKEDADQARQRLKPTTNIEDLKDVDFVIEAVPVPLTLLIL